MAFQWEVSYRCLGSGWGHSGVWEVGGVIPVIRQLVWSYRCLGSVWGHSGVREVGGVIPVFGNLVRLWGCE